MNLLETTFDNLSEHPMSEKDSFYFGVSILLYIMDKYANNLMTEQQFVNALRQYEIECKEYLRLYYEKII
jgi:hypothetical protein